MAEIESVETLTFDPLKTTALVAGIGAAGIGVALFAELIAWGMEGD